jgi:hypothetical protein
MRANNKIDKKLCISIDNQSLSQTMTMAESLGLSVSAFVRMMIREEHLRRNQQPQLQETQ